MDVGFSANDKATIWVHDFKGHPIIEHEPQISTRQCTITIGKIEIVILKQRKEKDHDTNRTVDHREENGIPGMAQS